MRLFGDAFQIDLKLAEAAKSPDWSAEVSYAARGPGYVNMMSVLVRMDLPIFQSSRQQPVVASKVAQLEQVRAQADDARARHVAEGASGACTITIARASSARAGHAANANPSASGTADQRIDGQRSKRYFGGSCGSSVMRFRST